MQGAIAYNLVDLALAAPKPVFSDIIGVFSQINRTFDGPGTNSDLRTSSNQVCSLIESLCLGLNPSIGVSSANAARP